MSSTLIYLLVAGIFNNFLSESEAQRLRIHGGTEAEIGEFPYMVYVRARGGYCSGSILTTTWVLTAAHCSNWTITSYKIRAGIVYIYGRNEHQQERRVKRLLTHPKFELFPHEESGGGLASVNDVGLVEVSKPFVFNQYVQGIAIWGSLMSYGPTSKCQMIGFGRTQNGESGILHHVPASSINDCSTINQHNISKLYSGDNYACVYGNRNQRTDEGDSGSPLVCHGYQYGILFDGMVLSKKYGLENLYTTTYGYLQWIKQYVHDVNITVL